MLPFPPLCRHCEWYLKAFVSLRENTKVSVFIYSNKTSKINPPYLTKINGYFHWSWTMFFHRLICSSHHIFEARALSSGKGRMQALSLLVFNDPCHFPQKQTLGTKLARVQLKIPHLLPFETPLSYTAGQRCFTSLNSLTPFHHTSGWTLLVVKCCLSVNFAKCLRSFSKEGTVEM